MQSYDYNEFYNLTPRVNYHWERHSSLVDAYVNDRRQTPAFTQPWEYDDEGNVLFDLEHRYKLDAAGRHAESVEAGLSITQGFDGDGRIVRRTEVYAEPAATPDGPYLC